MLFTVSISIISCNEKEPDKTPSNENSSGLGDNGGGENENGNNSNGANDTVSIAVPEYKDYGRGTVNFQDMTYSRPDISAAVAKLGELVDIIEKNDIEYSLQLEKIKEIDPVYTEIVTMSSLAEIHNNKNSSDSYWAEEKLYITTSYPSFSQAVEKLFIAAASSPSCDSFASDYFGEDLYDYCDGGIYTDELVEIMAREAELENKYSSISTATTEIVFHGKSDVYDAHLAECEAKYQKGTKAYNNAVAELDTAYETAVGKLSAEILVELVKIRREISDELGYESYRDFAYDTLYHDYDSEDMEAFIYEIKEFVIPVYVTLSSYLFSPYISGYEQNNSPTAPKREELINSLYSLYSETDEELGEIFAYMLQHELYDIDAAGENRFDGAFTAYIEKYNSPYVFVSLSGNISDYMTLSHEFGHFVDQYTNYGDSASLDLAEVSSQALELLTLTRLTGKLDDGAARYMSYIKLEELFSTIIFQGFYASVEEAIYKIPYKDITLARLNATVAQVAAEYGLSASVNSVDYIIIPHTILYPFYVQSYATSASVAAEIFCLEKESEGAGFEAFNKIIERDDEEKSFEELVVSAGLTSPFEKGALKSLADDIYYILIGAHFFNQSGDNAA